MPAAGCAPMRHASLKFVAALGLLCLASSHSALAQSAAAYRAAVEQRFGAWLEGVRAEAVLNGITPETFNRAMKGVELDWKLPDLTPPDLGPGQPARPGTERTKRQKQQAEFDRPAKYFPESGLAFLTRLGRKHRAEWKVTLEAIEEKFGVEGHIVLAIWGRETAFGRARLPHDAMQVLATQAFMGRRRKQFREELLLALGILQEGHVRRGQMRSSWAGAMGHTQFLPSDFRNYAVDFDGDGRRDIWGSIPDALASTANSLAKNGWRKGKAWGYEVRLPEGFDCTLEGISNLRTIREWAGLGVTRAFGREFPPQRLNEKAHVVAPAGTLGPAFLVMENFEVFRSYNKADTYALYVGHVADRILFDSRFEGGWERVESFSRGEMRRLQTAMKREGLYDGKIDGLMGSLTRAAIGAWQKKLGHEATCYPSRALLKYAPPLQN